MKRSYLQAQAVDIPANKTWFYRLFEIIPGLLSIIAIALAFVLSAVNPLVGAVYILAVIIIVFIKGLATIINSWLGFNAVRRASLVDWHQRLIDLDAGCPFHIDRKEYDIKRHISNIEFYQRNNSCCPLVDSVHHLIIIAAYNETDDVLVPTIASLIDSSCNKQKMVVCLAYEERGGDKMHQTAKAVQSRFRHQFKDFVIIKHPRDLKGEVVGKGSNITYAGKKMSRYFKEAGINFDNIIVTTLDSDNRPHQAYFDYVAYEFITRPNRHNLAFQPVALFLNNIWDTPAPVRVSAAGDSIWNTVSTVRKHKIRNFAAHSQSMKTLDAMNFWSTRTIVEDGHQYWRSFFFLKGHYDVLPIRVPIYQDAVLSSNYRKTLADRFVQVRRWAYGASDIPYVANMIRQYGSKMPLAETLFKFIDLVEGHVSWASSAVLVLLGGWIPALFSSQTSMPAHQLPITISIIQNIAMIGVLSMIVLFFKFLPIRPRRYGNRRSLSMWLQWIIYPFTAVVYGSLAAFYSQMRLMTGRYLVKFDVTDKNTVHKD